MGLGGRVQGRVAVLAVGDAMRSPRSLYHTLAFARAGWDTHLLALEETPVDPGALGHATFHRILDVPPRLGGRPIPWAARAGLRAAAISGSLATQLARLRPSLVLAQTPPALPTLPVAAAACRATGARLIVDWHNLGHALLALRLGSAHVAVGAARRLERASAPLADAHLAVTPELAAWLARSWNVPDPLVLRDAPATRFRPASAADRAQTRAWLAARFGRPALADPAFPIVVSSTSWSADEDFVLLREALTGDVPPLAVLVTGAGPGRAAFQRSVADAGVTVLTDYFAHDEYPRVLAAADLGICLHRSASGLDLPMKALDMLGAGLPVLALDDGAPLVTWLGRRGLPFRTAADLRAALVATVGHGEEAPERLAGMRGAVAAAPGATWEEAWAQVVPPLVARLGVSA